MKLDKSHAFGKEEALSRLQALTHYWSSKYGVQSKWNGDQARVAGKVKGIKFSGEFSVGDGRITGDIEAGFLAEKLGGRQYVEGKLDEYLDPDTSLDSLQARA